MRVSTSLIELWHELLSVAGQYQSGSYRRPWRRLMMLGERLIGRHRDQISNDWVVIELHPDGSVKKCHYRWPQRDLDPLTDSLQTAGQPYILFDPFDGPWMSAIGWFRVSQRQMEAFIGKPLEFFVTDSVLPLGLGDDPGQRITPWPDFEFPETWRKAY